MQAVQTERGRTNKRERSENFEGVPSYRPVGRVTLTGSTREIRRNERFSSSSDLQSDYRSHTEPLRRSSSFEPRAEDSEQNSVCDRCDLRRRIQFKQSFLREFE